MANQTGIAIDIRAFLPTGKTLDEQFAALSLVKKAHETGDYTELLKAASVEKVKAEQKTRRVEDTPPTPAPAATEGTQTEAGDATQQEAGSADEPPPQTGPRPGEDDEIPVFIKKGSSPKAA